MRDQTQRWLDALSLQGIYSDLSQALKNKQIKSYVIIIKKDADIQYSFMPVEPIKCMTATYKVDTGCLENG